MVGTLAMAAGAWLLGDLVVGMMIGRVLRESSRDDYSLPRGYDVALTSSGGRTLPM